MSLTYTYRDGRITSPVLRSLNAVGRAVEGIGLKPSLNPDGIVAAAIKEAGSSDFGGDSYREPLERYVDALELEADLSTFGRIALRKMLVSHIVTRLRLQAWTTAHPEALREEVRRPWVILGLPRTGTSLLSMLLALDPLTRPLLQWEGRAVVPPPTLATANEDPRIAKFAEETRQFHKLNPAFRVMHPMGAMLAEECIPLMMLDLRCLGMETQALVPSYGQWLRDCDMTPAYIQHKKGLQALQAGIPTENWVLKTPNHLWCIDTLLSFYPDARLIWAHRDPGPVTTSVASLNATLQGIFAKNTDPHAVGSEWIEKLRQGVARGMDYDDRARARGEGDWCVHIQYSELMRDPTAAVRKIYAHFGEEPSPLHTRRIGAWMSEKPQDEFGRHEYVPEDFGWSYNGLAKTWSDYVGRFNIERER